MPPTFYRGCWHVVSRDLFLRYCPCSSLRKVLYDPKAFIAHAALLHQAFAHCAIFPTAATRRCMDRVSVPLWGATLSGPLPVVALVSHYLTNKLIMRRPFPKRRSFSPWAICGIRPGFPGLSLALGYVPTCYSAVRRSTPEVFPLDLHVLGTPPAFILSQDQTLHKESEYVSD